MQQIIYYKIKSPMGKSVYRFLAYDRLFKIFITWIREKQEVCVKTRILFFLIRTCYRWCLCDSIISHSFLLSFIINISFFMFCELVFCWSVFVINGVNHCGFKSSVFTTFNVLSRFNYLNAHMEMNIYKPTLIIQPVFI